MLKPKLILLLVVFSLGLAGCNQTANLKTVCPTLKNYSPAQLTKLAGEYGVLPGDVQSLISDYRLLRRQCQTFGKD